MHSAVGQGDAARCEHCGYRNWVRTNFMHGVPLSVSWKVYLNEICALDA
jgi:hypothetical protein